MASVQSTPALHQGPAIYPGNFTRDQISDLYMVSTPLPPLPFQLFPNYQAMLMYYIDTDILTEIQADARPRQQRK